jgi:hypothetical protein
MMGYGFNMVLCLVRNRPVLYYTFATNACSLPPLAQRGSEVTFVT